MRCTMATFATPSARDSFHWACIRRTNGRCLSIRHASSYTTRRLSGVWVGERRFHPRGGARHEERDGGVVTGEPGGVEDLDGGVEVERLGGRAVEEPGEVSDDEASQLEGEVA